MKKHIYIFFLLLPVFLIFSLVRASGVSAAASLPPAPNATGSCPAPGTTASFSWDSVTGADWYDAYIYNTADSWSWATACASPNQCHQKLTSPSTSFSTTPGANYNWYIFACNSAGCTNAPMGSFTCTAQSVPTASITGPGSGTVGQALSYTAQVANGGSLSIFASRQDNAQFNCPAPGRAATDSSGRNWCILSEIANATSGTATFTPPTAGTYAVLVNGYANSTAGFTSNKTTECTGNHFGLNATQQAQWSDCGTSSSITVSVAAAASSVKPTVSFTANPSSVTSGQSTTLTWSSTNAVSCVLMPPGVYKTVDPSGSDSFSLTTTTTYNIRCDGVGGAANSATASTTVTVTTAARRDLCVSTAVSPGTVYAGDQLTVTATANEASLRNFRYAFYNRDNSMKGICQQGITSVVDAATTASLCPNGGAPFVIDKTAAADATSLPTAFNFADLNKPDTNWNNKIPTHFRVNGYFIDQYGVSSTANENCSKPFDIVSSATFDGKSLDLTGATALSTTLVLPSGSTSVDVPIVINPDSGSPKGLTIRFNYLAPPTNPSASCPAPGTTASFNWTGVNGAGGYTVYAFDKSKTIDWSVPCGSGGRDVCTRVTGTSASASGLRSGVEYQWFVFACVGDTNNCSIPASYGTSFTCGAASAERRDLCISTAVSSGTVPAGGQLTITSTSKEANLRNFRYAFYNRDNSNNIICQQGITSVVDAAETARQCPNGGAPFVIDKPAAAGAKSLATTFNSADLSKPDTNSSNQIPTHFQVNGYFIDQFEMSSTANTNCSKPFDVTSSTSPALAAPTNPSASCPAPGTTASFNWTGVSGATRYDLYVHNTADPALVWGSTQSGGNACTSPNFCEPLTTTSKSLSGRIPGATYQWFVFACNSSGCSKSASDSTTFICGASSPLRSMPGDADDNSCVNVDDLAQWKKERGGDCHRCTAWTPGATRQLAEDYVIWYDAFKGAGELCDPAPVSNCTTNVCQ